jgi:hypothetical protein
MTDVTARAVAVRRRLGGISRAPTCSLASRIAPFAARPSSSESAGAAGLQPSDTEGKAGLWPAVPPGPWMISRGRHPTC